MIPSVSLIDCDIAELMMCNSMKGPIAYLDIGTMLFQSQRERQEHLEELLTFHG